MVWLCRLLDRDSIQIQYTINHPTTLYTQWNPVTHCCSPLALCAAGCCLSTPIHPRVPLVWPYCRQAQCGRWHSLKWSIADLLTSQSSSNVSLPFAWITGPAADPSYSLYLFCRARRVHNKWTNKRLCGIESSELKGKVQASLLAKLKILDLVSKLEEYPDPISIIILKLYNLHLLRATGHLLLHSRHFYTAIIKPWSMTGSFRKFNPLST